jgi:uncharacterized caspase-like protein
VFGGVRGAWARDLLGLVLIALLAGVLPAPASAQAGKRVALLIGNQNYRGEPGNEKGEWPRLSNPINDVNDLERALKRFGFETTLLKNLNKLELIQAIEDFGRRGKDVEAAVFYYAGHGAERDGVNYLIPVNAGPINATGSSIESDGVRLGKVLLALGRNAATNIVFIDACRKLPGGRGSPGAVGMAAVAPPRGTIISFAAKPGTGASDGIGMRNGFFAQGLLKALAGTDLSLIGVLAEAGRVVQSLRDCLKNRRGRVCRGS